MPAVTECTAHCPPFGKRELAGLAGQSSASNSIAPINSNENFVILKTGSINGAGDSLTVSGTINGTSCEITVDTGSNISIVRPDILKDVDRSLLQPVHSYIRTMTGEQAPIHGKAQFQLGIGPLVLPQELWVADIQDQCILGLDFLYPNGCQVNLRDQLLTIGEHQIPLKRPSIVTDQVCKAVLVRKVCLPPLAETIVPVRIEGAQLCTVGLLEQSTDQLTLMGCWLQEPW